MYRIIEVNIEINKGILCKEWGKFEIHNSNPCDLMIRIIDKNMNYEIEEYTIKNDIEKCYKINDSIILWGNEEKSFHLIPGNDINDILTLLLHLFYTKIVNKKVIQLHSSLISHQNQGVMFLGPSGIGKTTQAELWQKYRSSLIINGDIVFVQETESGFLGWGTPWHGSSPYCENTSVPLKAMVVLKQAEQNSIRELTGFEKVTEVSNSVFYPQWLENGMELCLETLDHLLTSIPVYELRCCPDEDAVRLTEQTVF